MDNVPGVTKKPELCLSAVIDEEGHPLEIEDEQEEDFVSVGETFSKHVWKARDIIRLLTISAGPLTRPSLMN